MANTYTQLHVHIVFSTKNRMNMIKDEFRENIHKYIQELSGVKSANCLQSTVCRIIFTFFTGLSPDISISSLVHDVKKDSTNFVNSNSWLRKKFNWQKGFGAFTYSHSQIPSVIKYIKNQKQHHKKKTFKEEYLEILNKFGVQYDLKYVFDEY